MPLFPAVAMAAALAAPVRGSGRGSAPWAITGLEIAIAVALCVAGVLADRRIRPPGRAATWASVRATSHPGPPTSVVLHDSAARPVLTMCVDQRAAAAGLDEP